ncbi:hypothetical protein [Burkholderia cenocepacia]|jgi:hypothetical protein|uniref:hypothetical protein n=1 Tax=Burkholderia cenocepacia TaxID=95486 RepID=UPI001F4B8023|nr:hypothetical protein [Burkholderia cenocepacia]
MGSLYDAREKAILIPQEGILNAPLFHFFVAAERPQCASDVASTQRVNHHGETHHERKQARCPT